MGDRGRLYESGIRNHKNGSRIAAISHAFLTLGDRYALEVANPQDALLALCTVLAIDCCDEEHSR